MIEEKRHSRSAGGRPIDLAKRNAILDAARVRFLADGYDRARMDLIAGAAGVSRATLFNQFGDKAGLMVAMVEREVDRLSRGTMSAEADHVAFPLRLEAAGLAIIEFIASTDVLAFERLLAQSCEGLELRSRFFEAGPGRVRRWLAALIKGAATERGVAVHDPVEAADDLIALWCGGLWREEIELQLRATPDAGEVAARVQRGVKKFLRLYPLVS